MANQSPADVWKGFCHQLEQAGTDVLNWEASPVEQAEGLRYLSRLLRISLEMNLENADPAFPYFYQASHETAKIGADNPDNIYLNATISGQHRYRVYGNRGSAPVFSFGSKANRYAVDGTMASTGELDVRDMHVEADGSFEVIVSKDKQEGNWLPLAEDSSMLLVRQTFLHRESEEPAKVRIETIDGPATPPLAETQNIATALTRSTAFVQGTAKLFIDWAEIFRRNNLNTLDTVDQTMFFRAGGDAMIYYLHGYWDIPSGKALKIKTSIPECEGWNFQLNNIWMESLDYRYHDIHVNNASAKLDDDGGVTIIVGERDPGIGNWLDTAGHTRGTMLLRWTGANEHPVPTCEVIDL